MGCWISKPYERFLTPQPLKYPPDDKLTANISTLTGKVVKNQDTKDGLVEEKNGKTLVIVFGTMGCGKSFRGLQLAKALGWQFYEGDDARAWYTRLFGFLCKDASNCFKRYFSVEHFLSNYLVPSMIAQVKTHKKLVVSQALYFADHRDIISATLRHHGIRVIYVYVSTDHEQQERQLLSRKCGSFWNWYAKTNESFFEPPKNHPQCLTFENTSLATIHELYKNITLLDTAPTLPPIPALPPLL